jgi:hypothetical protein
MMKFVVAAGAVALTLVLSACAGGSPQEKMTAACLRMNTDANAQANCSCMVGKLKEKLSDSEMSELADALNKIVDDAGGNSEIVGQQIGTKVMTGTLVNQKVGSEFLTASKACSAPAAGTPPPATTPAPAPAPVPTPTP